VAGRFLQHARTGRGPPLQSFYILTIALVDAKLQAHARKITAQHQQKGLFDSETHQGSEGCASL
jgi:hypothetical protein